MTGQRLRIKRRAELDIESVEHYYHGKAGKAVADGAVDAILARVRNGLRRWSITPRESAKARGIT